MKILFISPVLPLPLTSGGQIRSYNLVKALSVNHEVILLSYYRQEEEKKHLSSLEKICKETILLKRKYKPWSLPVLLKTLFSSRPLVMNLYDTEKPLISEKDNYDLIYCECFYLMDKIGKTKIPIMLSDQNIEYLAYQRYLDNLPLWKKVFFWLPMKWDILKMKHWEKRMWLKADKLAVMSDSDKKIVEKEIERKNTVIVPNGVDTGLFNITKQDQTLKTILFVGDFKWFQNVQAVEWLIKGIFPEIKKQIPKAKLSIVGRHMPQWLQTLKIEGIILDETVEDIRDAYKKATVFLAPLKSGSGTKYKILEAMASGVPVVTTSIGAEGLDNSGMIIKKTGQDLAKATIDVLNNPQKYEALTKKARKLVEDNYTWSMIGKKLEEFISK